eukprot:1055572-Amphidinium_carterae.1
MLCWVCAKNPNEQVGNEFVVVGQTVAVVAIFAFMCVLVVAGDVSLQLVISWYFSHAGMKSTVFEFRYGTPKAITTSNVLCGAHKLVLP